MPNDDDNCPDHPNGPDAAPPTVDSEGFVRHWLMAGPVTGRTSPDRCLPPDEPLVDDDTTLAPAIGDPAGALVWRPVVSPGSRVDYLDAGYGSVGAPREVYVAVYVHSEASRVVTLALGPDDGARGWLNGVEVIEIAELPGHQHRSVHGRGHPRGRLEPARHRRAGSRRRLGDVHALPG